MRSRLLVCGTASRMRPAMPFTTQSLQPVARCRHSRLRRFWQRDPGTRAQGQFQRAVDLASFKSIPHSIVEHPLIAAVVAVLFVCALVVWVRGRSTWRAIILAVIVSGLCVSSFKWGLCLGGPDKWNILISVATLLAVLAALFSDVIQKLVYREKISVHVGSDLIDFPDGLRWIRGRITNSGDRTVERCRVKLLKVEGQPSRIENGLLQWQGGIREPGEPVTLSSQEHLIFDIGTRIAAEGSPLQLLAYIGPNQL